MVKYDGEISQKDLNPNSGPSVESAINSYVSSPAGKSAVPKEQIPEFQASFDKFIKKIKGKFGSFLASAGIVPNTPDAIKLFKEILEQEGIEIEPELEKKINVIVIIEDAGRKKMDSKEMKTRVSSIVSQEAKKVNKNFNVISFLSSDIWQMSLFGNYEFNKLASLTVPLLDKGILAGLKIAEVHKNMVVQELSRYITSYVLAGSLTQGKYHDQSDIDVFVVIDDTDVVEMSNVELKAKLRQLILTLGAEAGRITGIQNKLNVQTYILTDFWESVKDANPVIFTFLRDGVPIYDKGVFMPWKRLLKTGRVKPSREAIETYKQFGDRGIQTAKARLRDIGTEDLFWALLTPSQAALMLAGVTPTTPKETPDFMREVFVKNNLLEESHVKVLDEVLTLRKKLEHGEISDVDTSTLGKLIKGSEEYLKRLEKLYEQVENEKEKESLDECYEKTLDLMKEVLHAENVKDVKHVHKSFEKELVETGKISEEILKNFSKLEEAKKQKDSKKASKLETEKAIKNSRLLMKDLENYIDRKKLLDLEKAKLVITHGEGNKKKSELILLSDVGFVIEKGKIMRLKISPNGDLIEDVESSMEEIETNIKSTNVVKRRINDKTLSSLKKMFGANVEILA